MLLNTSSKNYLDRQIKQTEQSFDQNIIRTTRRIIQGMNRDQRFDKAKAHVLDALKYKSPRPQSQSLNAPSLFKCLYWLHSSALWQWLLFALSYVYMYCVIMESQIYAVKIATQGGILAILWFDTIIIFYCRGFDSINKKNRLSMSFCFKVILLTLMVADLIIFITMPAYDSRPIRPFRILRCIVPLLYHPEMRKTVIALAYAYVDILVYFIFFAFIIVGWAFVGVVVLRYEDNFQDPKFPQAADSYKTAYNDLGAMIYMVYVTATYDSYPDNQILAIQSYEPNYIYYIVFIFLNMFLFSSIPGSLIYLEYRKSRSKILLVDQIRQQHSLLIAFVTLAQGKTNLAIQTLIQFLLELYRFKIRFIEYITDICLRLDANNNTTIQVSQFMELSKILLQNEVMLPPNFDDVDAWITFRRFINKHLKLKDIVKSLWFDILISILVILAFINAIFLHYQDTPLTRIFNSIFIWLFVAQFIIRLIAIGPQNLLQDNFQKLDSFFILLGIIFQFVDSSNTNTVFRLVRIFRIPSFMNAITKAYPHLKFKIWHKLKDIFSTILQIFPIILKFFPLFMFFFYIFAIIGMQVFYDFYTTTGIPAYNMYQQFSSFRTFIQAQYIMVQVLTEAGWSMIAYDHSWRNPQYFAYIMLYFCLMHIVITYIIATLIKGIFWQVFFTVNSIHADRDLQAQVQAIKEAQNNKKAKEIEEVNQLIEKNKFLVPNTILKRDLVDNKIDIQIFKRLYQKFLDKKSKPKKSIKHQDVKLYYFLRQQKNSQKSKKMINSMRSQRLQNSSRSQQQQQSSSHNKIALHEIDQIDQQDFQSQLSSLLSDIKLNPNTRFTQYVSSPKIFVQFLKKKIVIASNFTDPKNFSQHLNNLGNQQSMSFHLAQLSQLLHKQTSKRQQKTLIIQKLKVQNHLTPQAAQRLIHKKLGQKTYHVDSNGILRTMFLSDTNPDLISKFTTQYFSKLYGHSFRQINRMTLGPLLKLQATLTYALKNILRYPQINNIDFFDMFTHIQDQLSNKLLQKGSLFKFIYKLDGGDTWFSIQFKRPQDLRVHFIKNGIWVFHKQMLENKPYYARDLFNWQINDKDPNCNSCKQYIKRLYQSFQGLAFSLVDQTKFFQSNPKDYVYDLFIQYFNVRNKQRFMDRDFQIDKIMVVILSKQEERKDIKLPPLPYNLTDIVATKPYVDPEAVSQSALQSQNQAFEKLKNMGPLEQQRVVQSQGLPFAYVVNMMKEIADIVNIYSDNFIFQIEKVLNDQMKEMNQQDLAKKQKSQIRSVKTRRSVD